MSMTDQESARQKFMLEQNALIDAQQLAVDLDRDFTVADLTEYKDAGLDLHLAAEVYVRDYEGANRFLKSVQRYLTRRGNITSSQARAVLSTMRNDLLKQEKLDIGERVTAEDFEHACVMCGDKFKTYDELDIHKSFEHGSVERKQAAVTDEGEAQDVLEVNESVLGLDLSNLPDGRYAAPDVTGKNDYIFLAVKRVRKTVKRDRRYVYGNVVVGNEIVVAGTIEVRIWSSDTKEWVGAQKPGDVYRGKYEDELQLIMMMPEPWAILFGRLLGYCGRCGKKLTDDVSREIGLGLECEKKREYFRQPPKYTYIGQDRPDKDKINPLDEKYLSGELKSWREPPRSRDSRDLR